MLHLYTDMVNDSAYSLLSSLPCPKGCGEGLGGLCVNGIRFSNRNQLIKGDLVCCEPCRTKEDIESVLVEIIWFMEGLTGRNDDARDAHRSTNKRNAGMLQCR